MDMLSLRTVCRGKLLKGAHAVDREYKVFDALRDTAVPVPKMLLFCDDADIIGTPFCAPCFPSFPAFCSATAR